MNTVPHQRRTSPREREGSCEDHRNYSWAALRGGPRGCRCHRPSPSLVLAKILTMHPINPTSPEAQRSAQKITDAFVGALVNQFPTNPVSDLARVPELRDGIAAIIESTIQSAHRELIGERDDALARQAGLEEGIEIKNEQLCALRSLLAEAEGAISESVEAMDALIILGEQNVPPPYKPLKERFVRDRARSLLSKLQEAQK